MSGWLDAENTEETRLHQNVTVLHLNITNSNTDQRNNPGVKLFGQKCIIINFTVAKCNIILIHFGGVGNTHYLNFSPNPNPVFARYAKFQHSLGICATTKKALFEHNFKLHLKGAGKYRVQIYYSKSLFFC